MGPATDHGLPPQSGWDGRERREHHWHLKKEITLGQLLVIASMLTGGVSYVIANERTHERHLLRLADHDRQLAELKQTDRDIMLRMDASVVRIEALIQRMDDKLERLVPRTNGNGGR